MKLLRFLLLENNLPDADAIKATLLDGAIDCELLRVETRCEFVAALESNQFDLILSDYTAPALDGLSALEIARNISPDVPFIFVSSSLDEELEIAALKSGATDYILKQRLGRLVPCVVRALRSTQEPKQAKELEQVNEELKLTLEELQVAEEELRQQNEELAIAQEAIVIEKQRYQDLFNFAPSGYVVTDAVGKITEANWHIAALVGRDPGYLVGVPLAVYISKSDCRAFRNLFYDLRHQHQLQTDELSLKPVNKIPIPVAITAIAVRDEKGQFVGARCSIQDITERKRAELNAQFLDKISQDLVIVTNIEEIVQLVGKRLCDYLKISSCIFTQINLAADQAVNEYNWHQDDMPSLVGVYRISEYVSAKFLQDAKAGKPVVVRNVNTDARIVDPQRFHKLDIGAELNIPLIIDGEWKFSFTVFHSQPYNWREDEIKLMQELANRIFQKLERTRVEAALRHSESRFRLMVESAKEYAIFTLDLNNIISSWNSGAERLLGYTETEAVGCSGKMIFTPEDKELQKPEQEIKLALTLGRAENERWHVRSDGSRFWGSGLMMPLLSETGNVQGFVKIMQDKTTQRQAHEQIQQQAEQLKQANRIKDEFLAVLSHELRSPLNPILGWSKILQTGKLDKAKTAQGLATIERNAKLQSELIEDLLDVSRILQGKLALNVASVDLVPTIQAAMETVQLAAQAKSIQIHTNLEPNVGQVSGDANRLQQIVWNLLSNAVKFTSQGGQVNIELRRRPLNNTVNTANTAQIIVSDNGIGIKPEFLPNVFDYFRQEDGSTTRRFGGLGLGLAIVRHLVELHGGSVGVESLGEGQGSTFTVTLPLSPNIRETNIDSKQPESSLNLEGIKVLVVDDDTDTREFITFMLSMYGASVTAVNSGAEALANFTQHKPDILVSDIGMPDIDGYMLIQQLRALAPEQGGLLPAIALTAFAGEINQQQALKAGFQRHISKPIEPATLITAIAELIGA